MNICHSGKCNVGVGFSKCWFTVVTGVVVVVTVREIASHGWTNVGFWGDAMWEGVGVGSIVLMALGVAAVVGRAPPVVVRLWVSNRDGHGVLVVAAGGRRRIKSCVFIYGFRVCLSFYFLHHYSSFTRPLLLLKLADLSFYFRHHHS